MHIITIYCCNILQFIYYNSVNNATPSLEGYTFRKKKMSKDPTRKDLIKILCNAYRVSESLRDSQPFLGRVWVPIIMSLF